MLGDGMVTHTWSKKLAPSGPDGSPQVGGDLLGVLVEQEDLGDDPLAQHPGGTHGPRDAVVLPQLA